MVAGADAAGAGDPGAARDRTACARPRRRLRLGRDLGSSRRRGFRASGLDISRQALERLDRPDRRLIEADLTRPVDAAVASNAAFDAVLALDVIEHLDDDAAALATLGRLVRPGGTLVVSVPALPELYSEFDRVQGHRRRYLPEGLRAAFDGAGLKIDHLFWWGSWLVPLFRARGKRATIPTGETPDEIYRRHLRLPPWPAPCFFRAAFAWDQRRALRGKTKTGTSLIAVAIKLPTTDNGPLTTDKFKHLGSSRSRPEESGRATWWAGSRSACRSW